MRRRFRPTLVALQAFEAAARNNSFTRAAIELNLTQGAISRQIRGLEDALGIRLFELVRRRVVLTELGHRYLADVRETIARIDESTSRVMALSGGADILELAALPTFCSRWLIPRLPLFLANHPGVLINCSTRMSVFSFRDEPFDAAIHFGPPVWPGAVLHQLFNEKMAPTCSPDFRARHNIVSDADLASAPLLQQTTRPDAWSRWFHRIELHPANAGRGACFDQFSMLAQAATAGLGAALLPEFLIEDELRSGRLVIVGKHALETDQGYYLAVPEEKTTGARIEGFRNWLLGVAKHVNHGAEIVRSRSA